MLLFIQINNIHLQTLHKITIVLNSGIRTVVISKYVQTKQYKLKLNDNYVQEILNSMFKMEFVEIMLTHITLFYCQQSK